MTQTLKRKELFDLLKKKSFKNTIQMQDFKNLCKSNLNQSSVRIIKNLKSKHCFLYNKKKEYLFVKLMQTIDNQYQIKSVIKKNDIKFPVKKFFNTTPFYFRIKFNQKISNNKNIPIKSTKTLLKNTYYRKKHLHFLRRDKKSKLLSSFYKP
jgi:hypothetical protein